MLFTNRKRHNFAKDPAVVRYNGRYYLYYTIKYDENPVKIGVGIAVSIDMESWDDIGELPLENEYEQNGIGAPAAIIIDGKIHLFYQTYGNGRLDAICHAVSEDGVSFVKNSENPIFRPTDDWCCGRAIDADVCLYRGKLFLYFATRDHEMKCQKIGCAYAYADAEIRRGSFSQAVAQSVLAPEFKWEGECIEAPAVIENRGKLFMFYGGAYNCSPQQIGCAVSEDGVFFKKLTGEPFKRCGAAGEWNSSESGHPYAFRDDDGRAYLFYQGSSDGGKTWYLSKLELGFDENNLPYIKEE